MIDATTFRLDGRLALVTGSSMGIGYALARGLAQAGAAVVLNARDEARLEAAAKTLRTEGHTIHTRAFDVCDIAAVQASVDAIERDIGAIDILVNNAGVQRRAPFHEMPAEQWQTLMRTNVDSAIIVSQAVARRMVERNATAAPGVRRGGRIVNICSVQSELGRPGIAAYAASKGALKMLTKGMAIDLGPHGITVNGLGPGYFKTELTAALVADAKFSEWLLNRTPSRRWGEVEELAPALVFLASDAARFVNGHILYVDGGVTATL
jgi:gluconate 5-dehydrogenase